MYKKEKDIFFATLLNRPGVAGTGLQTPSLPIDLVGDPFPPTQWQSGVTCHVSGITCNIFFGGDKLVKLFGGGSFNIKVLSTGPTPSSFYEEGFSDEPRSPLFHPSVNVAIFFSLQFYTSFFIFQRS